MITPADYAAIGIAVGVTAIVIAFLFRAKLMDI